MLRGFDAIRDVISEVWRRDPTLTVTLLGPPGTGKTSIGRVLAAQMGPDAVCEVLDLTSRLPEDIGGLPYREGERACYATQDWLMRLNDAPYGVVVLDDMAAALPSVATACRQFVLDRKIHGVHLNPNIRILVTGNRRKDLSGARDLPAHFRNATLLLDMEADMTQWCQWYMAQGLSDVIPRFIQARPAHFSKDPTDAGELGSFATPRSWARLGKIWGGGEMGLILAPGLVGEGVASELDTFARTVATLPAIEDVIKDPTCVKLSSVKEDPDKMVALTSGVAMVTNRNYRAAGGGYHDIRAGIMALQYLTTHASEYTMAALGPMFYGFGLQEAHSTLKQLKADPHIVVINEISAVLGA